MSFRYNELPATIDIFTNKEDDRYKVLVAPKKLGYTVISKSINIKLDPHNHIRAYSAVIELPEDYIDNSCHFTASSIFPSPDLFIQGAESLINVPCGCFEQTSATMFPMVLLFQYLNSKKPSKDDIPMKIKILTNLKTGVKKLLSYESEVENSNGLAPLLDKLR